MGTEVLSKGGVTCTGEPCPLPVPGKPIMGLNFSSMMVYGWSADCCACAHGQCPEPPPTTCNSNYCEDAEGTYVERSRTSGRRRLGTESCLYWSSSPGQHGTTWVRTTLSCESVVRSHGTFVAHPQAAGGAASGLGPLGEDISVAGQQLHSAPAWRQSGVFLK